MNITFKTLQQQTFSIEIDDGLTVKDLKKRVNEERGADFPADSLNLIYSGAIMQDDALIKDYKIDSKKFIVVMKKKEKVEPAPSTAEDSPSKTGKDSTAPASSGGGATAADSSSGTKKTEKEEAKSTTTTETASRASTESSAENENVIQNMMELGYSRPLVERALQLSYGNPDIACENLINGRITEANMNEVEADVLALAGVADEYVNYGGGLQMPTSGGNVARTTPTSQRTSTTNPDNDPLMFLRSQPQFHQMRQQIQQNPSFLNTVLQQIGVNNPGLLKLISENQNAFVDMINEPINNNNNNTNNNRNVTVSTTSSTATAAATAAATATGASPGASEQRMEGVQESGGGGAPAANLDLTANDDLYAATLASQVEEEEEGGVTQSQQRTATGVGEESGGVNIPIGLSESDRAAIARIQAISGFPEIDVIQAYFACGKDEDMAADLLFND